MTEAWGACSRNGDFCRESCRRHGTFLIREAVKEIHLEYLRAGADVVTANTFGANGFKYKKDEGYSLGSIVTAGVSLAKEAVKEAGHGYAALDLGPTGRLLWPPAGIWISRMHVRRIKRWWRLESGQEPT